MNNHVRRRHVFRPHSQSQAPVAPLLMLARENELFTQTLKTLRISITSIEFVEKSGALKNMSN